MNAASSIARFQALSGQIQKEGSSGLACRNLPTPPVDGYQTAEIFLGSHVSRGPDEADLIHVMSFRPDPGGERILEEAFMERTERSMMDTRRRRPGTPVLYYLVKELVRGSSGAQCVDMALATVDLSTGTLRSDDRGNAAFRKACRLEEETGLHVL